MVWAPQCSSWTPYWERNMLLSLLCPLPNHKHTCAPSPSRPQGPHMDLMDEPSQSCSHGHEQKAAHCKKDIHGDNRAQWNPVQRARLICADKSKTVNFIPGALWLSEVMFLQIHTQWSSDQLSASKLPFAWRLHHSESFTVFTSFRSVSDLIRFLISYIRIYIKTTASLYNTTLQIQCST